MREARRAVPPKPRTARTCSPHKLDRQQNAGIFRICSGDKCHHPKFRSVILDCPPLSRLSCHRPSPREVYPKSGETKLGPRSQRPEPKSMKCHPVRKHRTTKGYKVKYIKILGLAVVAAIAAMAVIGAGTASASELCTEAPEAGTKCKAGTVLELVHILAEGKDPVLKVSATESILCEKIHILIHVKRDAGPPVRLLTANKITWTNCKAKVAGCSEAATVTSPGEPSGEIVWNSSENGGSYQASLVNPVTEVKLTCGFPITCKYATSETILAKGNNNAQNADVNQAIKSPGFPCPAGTEEAKTTVTRVSGTLLGGGEVGAGSVFVAKE